MESKAVSEELQEVGTLLFGFFVVFFFMSSDSKWEQTMNRVVLCV